MTSRARVLVLSAFILACGGGIPRPTTTDLVVTGTVYGEGDSGQRGDPASHATVHASVDKNHDGKIDSDETNETTTDDSGKYKLQFPVALGDKVVIRYQSSASLPTYKTVVAGPKSALELNAQLPHAEQLACNGGVCETDGQKLAIGALPNGISGGGRTFNPASDTNLFPGRFGDDKGNLLVSGVFSAVSLKDASGNDVSHLNAPADLSMRMPQETWKTVVDLTPGNDRIEVPLFSFDEVKGEWVRDGGGYIVDDLGHIVPESSLASIRDGSFQGSVLVTGKVSHFSYWNVDWPIDTKTCLNGIINADDDKPAEGALAFITGLTYTGRTEPKAVGADGAYCDIAMRSEGPNEDVDHNNHNGDTQKVSVRVIYAGKLYDGGKFDTKVDAAECGGACLDFGKIKLTSDKELKAKVCDLKGTVVDLKGNPVSGTLVYAFDEDVPEEIGKDVCGFASHNCTLVPSTTGADGKFEYAFAALDNVNVFAVSTGNSTPGSTVSVRLGQHGFGECPTAEVTVPMNDGFDAFQPTLTVSGNSISWTPAKNAHRLEVKAVNGTTKWEIESTVAGFATPVTYGQVPAGATQVVPANNQAPAVMIAGDTVDLTMDGVGTDGYHYQGQAHANVQ